MTIFTFMPDWLIATALLAAICVFIVGRVRLAMVLALPAAMRFLVWPALIKMIEATPVYVLVIVGVLVLPVLAARAVRGFLILFVGAKAADHALGRAIGQGIIHLFSRGPSNEPD